MLIISHSDELSKLILSMLHLDPEQRPKISQILALPICQNTLFNLQVAMHAITCTLPKNATDQPWPTSMHPRSKKHPRGVRSVVHCPSQKLSLYKLCAIDTLEL